MVKNSSPPHNEISNILIGASAIGADGYSHLPLFVSEALNANEFVRSQDKLWSAPEHFHDWLASRFPDAKLPTSTQGELYLIRQLLPITLPGGRPWAILNSEAIFLFVLDFGFPSLAGVRIPWNPVLLGSSIGLGDPAFPVFDNPNLQAVSIRKRTHGSLLNPDVAGEVLIGLVEGAAPAQTKSQLEGTGLVSNVRIDIGGRSCKATCRPFFELEVCERLRGAKLSIIESTSPNQILGLIDGPPRVVIRLA